MMQDNFRLKSILRSTENKGSVLVSKKNESGEKYIVLTKEVAKKKADSADTIFIYRI